MRNSTGYCLTVIACLAVACSAENSTNSSLVDSTGGSASGGDASFASGGSTVTGGQSSLGGQVGSGGQPATGGETTTGGQVATGGSLATGGTPATGGFVGTGGLTGTGGFVGTGGRTGTGGFVGTGGRTGTGGFVGTGGMSTGGEATGGVNAGGTATGGEASGGSSTGGDSTGGTGSGDCVKGQVTAKEVIIMGESFYAMAPQYIQKRIEENARNAGAIGASDSYRNVAISGQPMSVVAGEFDTALGGGPVKVVIMDGGGIDCMSSSCDSCPGTFETLLTKMASNGVQDVIYTRYPEPGNPPGSNTSLKNNLDILMPKMEAVCAAATGLRCHWVDLRPVWVNGDTSDGLHPTQSGGNHCGDAIWAEMVKDCIAQ